MHTAIGTTFKKLALLSAILFAAAAGRAMDNPQNFYASFSNGLPSDPNYFPIAVWLQSPPNAAAYKAAGINLFIGLWDGPDDSQLSGLASAGMKTICDQNSVGLAHVNDKTIQGWFAGDEPDNAQSDGNGGYGPPIDPSVIIAQYNTFRSADATRPVFLNLGQGVAWDGWYGRGVRTNHPEDYYQYVKGCDMVGFDIYPVNSSDAAVSGNLWYVPQGIDRLRTYVGDAKPVFCWIECTKIDSTSANKPTPSQVRSEVWMALIHGANGFGYFCHSWTPSFDEAALLHDTTMLAAVKALNQQVQSLAPVLNSATIKNEVTIASSNSGVPLDIMVKHHNGSTYVFAAAMRNSATNGTFTVPSGTTVTVIGENRSLAISGGKFSDSFAGYGVHLYQFTPANNGTPAIVSAASATPNPATVNSSVALSVTATDPNGKSLTYAWAFGDGAAASGASVSHAYAAAGNFKATVAVSNGTNSVSSSVTVAVNAAPPPPAPPAITSALTASGTVGAAFSYAITATNSPQSFNATGLPAGLTVNAQTGVVSGTPTAAGTFSVLLSARNDAGTGTATLALSISPAQKTLHIAGFAMSLSKMKAGRAGIAALTVVDNSGAPVPGVTVNGTWSGLVSGDASASTNSAGKVRFVSPRSKKAGSFTFTITSLSLAGYIYAATADVADSGTIATTMQMKMALSGAPVTLNAIALGSVALNTRFSLPLPPPDGMTATALKAQAVHAPPGVRVKGGTLSGLCKHAGAFTFTVKFQWKNGSEIVMTQQQYVLIVAQ